MKWLEETLGEWGEGEDSLSRFLQTAETGNIPI